MTPPMTTHRQVRDRPAIQAACRQGSPEQLDRVARAVVAQIRSRVFYLPDVTYDDSQWLMLLELFIASGSDREVCVSNLCVASDAPPTTALRHIGSLERKGLLIRLRDAEDRRVSRIRLTERAQQQLETYLSSIAPRWLAGNDDLPAD